MSRCQCVWTQTTGWKLGPPELHACAACLLGGLIAKTETKPLTLERLVKGAARMVAAPASPHDVVEYVHPSDPRLRR